MLIANIFGVFVFLYIYWKRLKEDYSSERIFNSALVLLLGALTGILITNYFFKDYWFWITILTISLSQTFVVLKLKLKFFECLDALIVSLLPWLSLFFLSKSILTSSLSSFLVFWVSLTSIFLFFLLDNFYRAFSWYKSGRVGFSGLATLGIFFIVRLISSMFFSNIVSFAPKFENVFSGTIAFLSFLLLFNLSRQDG